MKSSPLLMGCLLLLCFYDTRICLCSKTMDCVLLSTVTCILPNVQHVHQQQLVYFVYLELK